MHLIGLLFVLVVFAAFKAGQKKRRVVFQVESRRLLNCGCVLATEEVSGRVRVIACAAHRAMAESL